MSLPPHPLAAFVPLAGVLLALTLAASLAACSGDASTTSGRSDAGLPDGADGPTQGDGGARDAATDAGVPPFTPGEPIVVAGLRTWEWVSMPSMRCANDTDGGFAVNFTDASDDLVIFFQGGGICYDPISCRASGLLGGVGANPIQDVIEAPVRDGVGIFDRNDPTNPFRDFSFVVLPHCTGDFHLGDNVMDYATLGPIHHRGYPNVTRALERIVPTFGDAERVVASGFSAGGVGITGNFHQIAVAFEATGGPTPVLIDDAGPKLRPPFFGPGGQAALRNSWALDGTIGRFCPTCLSTGLHELDAVNQRLHPEVRSSLLCAREDGVVVGLYAYFNLDASFDGPRLSAGLDDLAGWFDALRPELAPAEHHVFYYGGGRHGAMTFPLGDTPGVAAFLSAQLGEGAWTDVGR